MTHAVHEPPPIGPQVGHRVILDLDRCIGCRSCSAACFISHRGAAEVAYGAIAEGALPLVCRQCDDPACAAACRVGALRREETGVVKRSLLLCIGCRSCVFACPFGAIAPDLMEHETTKCDLCEARVLAGGRPRCVETCVSGALRFESPDTLAKDRVLLIGGRVAGEHPYRRR